jgi:hypothetical protein
LKRGHQCVRDAIFRLRILIEDIAQMRSARSTLTPYRNYSGAFLQRPASSPAKCLHGSLEVTADGEFRSGEHEVVKLREDGAELRRTLKVICA